ncbi:RNA recognition motif family protein [Cryptosporidium serpentis]
MDCEWKYPKASSKFEQLLIINCELWCVQQPPTKLSQSSLSNALYPISQKDSFDEVRISMEDEENLQCLIHVSWVFIDVYSLSILNENGFSAILERKSLSPSYLSYCKPWIKSDNMNGKLNNLPIFNLSQIHILLGSLLYCCSYLDECCCSEMDKRINVTLIAWDILKIQKLLGVDDFNRMYPNMKYCPNSLRSKLIGAIDMDKFIKINFYNFYPRNLDFKLEVFSKIYRVAVNLGIIRDTTLPNDDSGSLKTSRLCCRLITKIVLLLIKEPYNVNFSLQNTLNLTSVDCNLANHIFATSNITRPVIRLRGLPWKTNIGDIALFLSPVCNVPFKNIIISYGSDNRMSGEAYVVLSSKDDMKVCISQLHGNRMGKRWIEVLPSSYGDFLECKKSNEAFQRLSDKIRFLSNPLLDQASESYVNRPVLRLRGLPWSTTESEIVQFFEIAGVKNISVDNVFLGYTTNSRPSGEACVVLPEWCNFIEVQRILNRRVIGKRYIEVFISSYQEVHSFKESAMSLNKGKFRHIQQDFDTLRVKGLHFCNTEADFVSFFDGCQVIAIVPITSGISNTKQFGQFYIKFATHEDAYKALQSKNFIFIEDQYVELFPAKKEEFRNAVSSICSQRLNKTY